MSSSLAAHDPPYYDPAPSHSQEPVHTLEEKYSNLKKRYFELTGKQEDVHRRLQNDLQKSMEINSKLRSERSLILDRVIELESRLRLYEGHLQQVDPAFLATHPDPNAGNPPASAAGAFPKSLLSQYARAAFVANLHQAMREIETEEATGDDPAAAGAAPPSQPVRAYAQPAVPSKRRADEAVPARVERDDMKRARHGRGAPSEFVPPSAGRSASPSNAPPAPSPAHSARNGSNGMGNGIVSADYDNQRNEEGDRADRSGERDQHHQYSPTSPRVANNGSHRLAIRREPESSPWLRIFTETADHPRPQSPSSIPPTPAVQPAPPSSSHALRSSASPHNLPSAQSLQTTFSLPPPPSASVPSHSTPSAPRPSEAQRFTKPKRLKAHTVTSKSYSIPTVPRDSTGRPKLPLNVGIMTVISLGEICLREHYHTERYIFPVGYSVQRRYLSTRDPTQDVVYHCTILDGGDGPKFQIVAADCPTPIVAGTATGAWSGIVKKANEIRKRQHSNSVSGPDYFGLGQNTIKHLIQELPGADRLKNYVWQTFVEGGPLGGRHAAVIPAMPEEYDSTPAGMAAPISDTSLSVMSAPADTARPPSPEDSEEDSSSSEENWVPRTQTSSNSIQRHPRRVENDDWVPRKQTWSKSIKRLPRQVENDAWQDEDTDGNTTVRKKPFALPRKQICKIKDNRIYPPPKQRKAKSTPTPPPSHHSQSRSASTSRGAQSYVRTQSPRPARDAGARAAPARTLASLVHDFRSTRQAAAPDAVARA